MSLIQLYDPLTGKRTTSVEGVVVYEVGSCNGFKWVDIKTRDGQFRACIKLSDARNIVQEGVSHESTHGS